MVLGPSEAGSALQRASPDPTTQPEKDTRGTGGMLPRDSAGDERPRQSPANFSRPSTISSTERSRTGHHGAGPTNMTGGRFPDPQARRSMEQHGATRVPRAF